MIIQTSAKEYFRRQNNKLLSTLNVKRVVKPKTNTIQLIDGKNLKLTSHGWVTNNPLKELQLKFNRSMQNEY